MGIASTAAGRKDSPRTSYDELVGWTTRHFPGSEPTHYWSAQDYVAVDELPYVGPLLPGSDHFFVATGFAKWGMTNGVAAALLLAKRLLGGQHARWAPAFASWSPHEPTGLATGRRLGDAGDSSQRKPARRRQVGQRTAVERGRAGLPVARIPIQRRRHRPGGPATRDLSR